jgi:hypothetical protein
MRYLLFLFAFGLQSTNINAAEKVNFKIKNATNDSIFVGIEYTVPFNDSKREHWSGYIAKHAEILTASIKMEKNTIIKAYCLLKEGGRMDIRKLTVTGKLENEPLTVTQNDLKTTGTLTTLLSSTDKLLQFDTSLFLEKSDYSPKNINALYNRYLGGLVVYRDTMIEAKKVRIIEDYVDPIELTTIMKTPTNGTIQDDRKYYFKTNNGFNLGANVPGIAKGNFSLNSESLYELSMVYQGCGVVDWVKGDEESISDKFKNSLSANTHYRLAKIKEKHPDIVIRQIDKAYILSGIYYELNEYSKAGAEVDISASSFITGSGNYSKEVKSTKKIIIGGSYLGYWCSEVSQQLTTLLDLPKGAVLATNLNIINSLDKKEDILEQYNKLRKDFPSFPQLTSPEEIRSYLISNLNIILQTHPEFKQSRAVIVKENNTSNNLVPPPNKINELYNQYMVNHPDLILPANIGIEQKGKILSKLE